MLAIIPARGGSKGLPGKNLKLLHGKPLIAYTIAAALEAKHIDRVVVSTDSEEIAGVASAYGAECPFLRPAHLSSDQARGIDVYRHMITALEEAAVNKKEFRIPAFVALQPTSPLRTAEDIDNAVQLFIDKDADTVISYCREYHPIRWHKYLRADGRFEEIFGNIFEAQQQNRQEERPSYYPNGAIYILKRDMLDRENYYTEQSFAYLMDRDRSVDIDSQDDFSYAEYLIRYKDA
jgi:CMP-N,N'-diacetyllegionaminic acid synthase